MFRCSLMIYFHNNFSLIIHLKHSTVKAYYIAYTLLLIYVKDFKKMLKIEENDAKFVSLSFEKS